MDTANTLCEAAGALKAAGAKSVSAYCTHAILSGGAAKRIGESQLDELVVTDTVPLNAESSSCDRIRGLTVASILAETVSRVYRQGSLSSLFS